MNYGGQAAVTPAVLRGPSTFQSRRAGARSHQRVVKRISPWVLGASGIAADLLAIAVAVAGAFAGRGTPSSSLQAGLHLALLTVAIGLIRRDYTADTMLSSPAQGTRGLEAWIFAVALASFGAALTRLVSSGADVATMLAGALTVSLARFLLTRQVRRWAKAGRLVARRIMLVGGATELEAFTARCALQDRGLRLVCTAVLRQEPGTLTDDLSLAVATARMRQPDDVVLLLPWSDAAQVSRSVEALRVLPVAIHLGPPDLKGAERHCIDAAGRIGVPLLLQPLSRAQRRFKRSFDLGAASVALVLLAPVFAAIALAVKLDSPGPVFFRQRRTGYNGQPFRILKFRSMRTMEDNASLRQVTIRDSRVTRVGRIFRRSSLDELPQLVNVLRGDMSLVGPRPHALAHDLAFSRTHERYPRRHAVKPGITGWAQVSGFRGETDTADKIEGRVRHDLAYVDNWSLRFDAEILLRTLFSPKTFRNAR